MAAFDGQDAARFRAVAESVQDALIAADGQGRIVFWSPGAERAFGWSADQVLGEPLAMLMPEQFRDLHRAGIERVRTGGERHVLGGPPVELVGLRADGTEFPIELTLGQWEEDGRPCFTGVVRDVTERRRNQDVLATQYAVAAALAGSQELDEGLIEALAAIGKGMAWQAGHVLVVDADVLRTRSTWHEDDSTCNFLAASMAISFTRGVGIPGRVWDSGISIWSSDICSDPRFVRGDEARAAGLQTGVCVPLVMDGQVRGVVEFFSFAARPEDPQMRAAIESLAGPLGQFLLLRDAEAELARSARRQRQAAELNDEIVQGLALAHYHLQRAEDGQAAEVVAATLHAAKDIVSHLLEGADIEPGRLRRTSPARLRIDIDDDAA